MRRCRVNGMAGVAGVAGPVRREDGGADGGFGQYLMVRRKYLLYWVMLNDTASEMTR